MAENSKKPRIRFKGFTEAWEQRKYANIADLSRGLTYSPSNVVEQGTRVLRSSNINEEYFVKSDEDVFVSDDCININYAQDGDILITAANGSSRLVGKHAILSDISTEKVVHGGFMLLARTKHPYFLNASMSSSWYKKFIDLYIAGGNGSIGNLSKSDLDNYEFLVPTNNEQQKIGSLFKDLDNLITLHQRKYDKLLNVKKALLEKMFPKNGKKTPEIRFKGFTEAWEQCKLNEMVDYISSNLTSSDASKDGNYELYDANNIIGRTNHEPIKTGYLTIIKDGAGVGRIRKMPKNTMFIGTMGALKPINNSLDFVFSLLTRFSLSNEFSGSTIPHIYFKDYGNNIYFVPKLKEQNKIGDLYCKLDNLITLHQCKCEKLKNVKKSLLEKMFV